MGPNLDSGRFFIEMAEQIVDLQFKGLRLIQNDKVLKFGTDAVLLASYVTIHKRETLVDLGTGTGIIPVLISGRVRASMTGIDIQKDACELAERNVELNGLDNITIIHGDLREIEKHVDHADVVTMNPPYDKPEAGEMNKDEKIRIARYEVKCDLDDIASAASKLLSTGGRFYMIHRAYRMAEIIVKLREHSLEVKEIRPIVKKADAEPRYILIKATKDGLSGMRLLPSLVIYDSEGNYTPEMRRIYHMEENNG